MKFSTLLRAARAKRGQSQSQFARALGLSLRSLQHWEQGRQPGTFMHADVVARLVKLNAVKKGSK